MDDTFINKELHTFMRFAQFQIWNDTATVQYINENDENISSFTKNKLKDKYEAITHVMHVIRLLLGIW